MTDDAETKSEKKDSKKKKTRGPRRWERRFIAQSSNNPWLVRVLGAAGATTLGAGTWAYVYGHAFEADEKLKPIPSYLIAAGAVLTGATIWLGTSSETPLRVGDPGISMEKGEVRRMPWWGVSQITWESGNLVLVVSGKDESGASWTFKVPVNAHAEAVGWLVKEALARVPKVVDIRDSVLDKLPGANPHAGMKIDLEPLQVVGKKDAITGKTISYEPDARVCTRCERVYFKRTVPKKCKCGASLLDLRAQVSEDTPADYDDDEDEDEDDQLEDETDDDGDESDDDEVEEPEERRK
ncbi:MAG: hypothetical protein JWP87_2002 [Labilithrix sp.]|nr:hypothetical protein [Labilithrix sp.]